MTMKGARRLPLWIAMVVPVLVIALACGPGAEPTPTPTATAKPIATPTVAPAATPTPTATLPGPTATPTPTGVATPTPTPGKQPKRGGTLRLTVSALPPNFDSQFMSTPVDYQVAAAKLYSNLLINYVGEAAECDICSEWHLENNGKAMVFKLIPGIKFQTGQELTSADVKYSLRMVLGEVDGLVSPRGGVLKEYIESIETPDKYTVRINLLRPSPFVPKVLAIPTIVLYREGTIRESLKTAPAGSGPFSVDKVVSGSSWSLVRNPNYFRPGQPYLDKVEITVIADQTTRIASFLTGRSDISMFGTPPPEQFVTILSKMASEGNTILYPMVTSAGLVGVLMVVSKPPFDNLKLRQAVNLALDRKSVGLITWGNIPQQPHLLTYSKGSAWSTRSAVEIWDVVPGWGTGAKKAQEIEQAKQLVKDAGYPKGLDIDQMSGNLAPYPLGSEEVQKQLTLVGIRTTLSIGSNTVVSDRLAALNYVMRYATLSLWTTDPDETLGQYWITSGPINNVGYSNPQVDKLYVQMSSEMDPVKRIQLLRQIEDIIVLNDAAYAPTPSPDGFAFWWKRVQGATVGQTTAQNGGLFRADRLWLEE